MLHPAPTTKLDPNLARGIYEGRVEPTATRPGFIVLSVPNSEYRLHLIPLADPRVEVGKRLVGVIRAEARRVDVCRTGGRYLDPVYGDPRRIQGTVVSSDAQSNTLVVNAGVPVTLKLMGLDRLGNRQRATDFAAGTMVVCGVLPGATFEPRS